MGEVSAEAKVALVEWAGIGQDPGLVESAFAQAVERVYPTRSEHLAIV